MLGIGLLLTVGTGIFVASEFALVNLDRADLEARQARGETGHRRTISALKRTSTHLSSAQLGITLTTLLTGFTMEPALTSLLSEPLVTAGFEAGAVRPVMTVIALVIATLASMLIGELVPKNFALAVPRQVARIVMPVQTAFTAIFLPAIKLLNGSANGLLRMMGVEPKEELSAARSAEELSSLVRRSAGAGTLEADTASLLSRTLGFARLTAADAMTPRLRVETVQKDSPAEAIIALARSTGFSRFPVTDRDGDDITGIVHIKQAVSLPREKRGEVPAGALATDIVRVPETMHLDALLSELRGRGYQMAVVVDEYGGTAGIVTLEDLVEEIVGDVFDEHDKSRAGIARSEDGYVFPGLLRPDELLEATGVRVPEDGPYETIGGYVIGELGRLPQAGDEIEMPDGGVLRVERLDGRRIDRLRYRAPEHDDENDDDAEAGR